MEAVAVWDVGALNDAKPVLELLEAGAAACVWFPRGCINPPEKYSNLVYNGAERFSIWH